MTQGKFIDHVNELKPILRGNWREIAEYAGVEYDTVRSYVMGYCPDVTIREAILYGINYFLSDFIFHVAP